jgi:hypothetical protein
MADQSTAVAIREQTRSEVALSQPLQVTSVAGRGEVERIEMPIIIPVNFQYLIPNKKKERRQDPDTGQWGDVWIDNSRVGLTSDGYDYANRVLGAGFWLPDEVPDEHGRMVRNPIHRPDYIYMRMSAVWYNAVGQLVSHTEDLEVDYKSVWYQARLKQPGVKQVLDADGQPVFDAMNMPMLRMDDHQWPPKRGSNESGDILTAEAQERRALEALINLRAHGMRYCQTVLRTRLLKVALGIKSLPRKEIREITLNVVGYRDKMDPDQRREQAETGLRALYGKRQPDAKPLTHEEMQGIEPEDVDVRVDGADSVAAAVVVEPPEDEQDPGPDDEFSTR